MENKYKLYECAFTGTILAENDEKAKKSFLNCLKEVLPNINNSNEVNKYITIKKIK